MLPEGPSRIKNILRRGSFAYHGWQFSLSVEISFVNFPPGKQGVSETLP